jgi:hypothetical protein
MISARAIVVGAAAMLVIYSVIVTVNIRMSGIVDTMLGREVR